MTTSTTFRTTPSRRVARIAKTMIRTGCAVERNGRPVAYDYNLCYRGRWHMWRGSFAIDFAQRSPGAVMTRHVLLAAIEDGAEIVDWGPGPMSYKLDLATRVENVCWWGTSP